MASRFSERMVEKMSVH